MIADGTNNGGVGELYPQQTKSADARLERQAARLGWNIPDNLKDKIVERQVKIAIEDDSSNRESTSAARVLASLNAQNIALACANIGQEEDGIEPVDPVALLIEMRRTIPNTLQ